MIFDRHANSVRCDCRNEKYAPFLLAREPLLDRLHTSLTPKRTDEGLTSIREAPEKARGLHPGETTHARAPRNFPESPCFELQFATPG